MRIATFFVWVLVILAGAACCLTFGIALYAHIRLRKRPLEMLYEKRAGQSDFAPLSGIPDRMVQFILKTEDSEFYIHRGFIPENIRFAIGINFHAGKIVTGGSTITQQLVKNLYFHFEKNYIRKAAELLMAVQAEKRLGKERILELYLNIIYFGNGVYGISDAARFYFGKDLQTLSANQILMLAIIPSVPTRGNPIQYPEVFERIRAKRLKRFVGGSAPLLTEEEAALTASYHADRLDPELRHSDEWTRNYPQEPPMVNERFGPYDVPGYHNPVEQNRAFIEEEKRNEFRAQKTDRTQEQV